MVRPMIYKPDELPPESPVSERLKRKYVGMRIGMLTVLYHTPAPPDRPQSTHYWVCRCDCGNHCLMNTDALTNGHDNKSCGCWLYSADGNSHERLYQLYKSMVKKCTDPESDSYKAYHNQFRDINIYPPWMDYKVFKEWALANGYDTYKRLFRKDEKKDYCPENCYWESPVSKSDIRRATRGWYR